jgi:hypothetical protein
MMLWEIKTGSHAMAMAVRRGRLLWLSRPLADDQQQLNVYDFCARDDVAAIALARDDERSGPSEALKRPSCFSM